MKKCTRLIVFSIFLLVMIPMISGAEEVYEDLFELTEGKPIDEEHEIDFTISNELTQEYDIAEIYAVKYQDLDNGYRRFKLEYSMPEGLTLFVFDPPEGKIINQYSNGFTHTGKKAVEFDIKKEELFSAEMVGVSFFTDDSNRFFVFFKTFGSSSNEATFDLTEGMPDGEECDITYYLSNKLKKDSDLAFINKYTFQKLDNGFLRFTINYSMPEGLGIHLFDAPNGRIVKAQSDRITLSGESVLQFDIPSEDIMKINTLALLFSTDNDSKRFFLMFDVAANNFTQDPFKLTTGESSGEEISVQFTTSNDLTQEYEQAEILGYTYQKLNNGYLRFKINYIMPEGLRIFMFGKPDKKVNVIDNGNFTSSGEEIYMFDISSDEMYIVDKIIVVFYGDDSNRFFLTFDVADNHLK